MFQNVASQGDVFATLAEVLEPQSTEEVFVLGIKPETAIEELHADSYT